MDMLGGLDVAATGQKETITYVHALGRFGRALATALCTLFFCTYRIQMMIPFMRSLRLVSLAIPPRRKRIGSMTREAHGRDRLGVLYMYMLRSDDFFSLLRL